MINYSFNIDDDGIGFLILNRKPVNALSQKFILQLTEFFSKIALNEDIKALVICSSNNHFSAGADLKERSCLPIEKVEIAVSNIGACFNELQSLPFPTISCINGSALGGGLELAISCDFRVAEESAVLGFPECSLGIIPGAGGTQRLPRLIGLSRAKYWIFTAQRFSAKKALLDGVVDFVTNDGNALEESVNLAKKITLNSPLSLRVSKYAIDKGSSLSLNSGLIVEKKAYEETLKSTDRIEALNAFNEKRKPKWSGK